jgi:hypothetical protein
MRVRVSSACWSRAGEEYARIGLFFTDFEGTP